nr:uncharacterized protein LOC120969758 [Aegilops tauschii subsp. strangulata]
MPPSENNSCNSRSPEKAQAATAGSHRHGHSPRAIAELPRPKQRPVRGQSSTFMLVSSPSCCYLQRRGGGCSPALSREEVLLLSSEIWKGSDVCVGPSKEIGAIELALRNCSGRSTNTYFFGRPYLPDLTRLRRHTSSITCTHGNCFRAFLVHDQLNERRSVLVISGSRVPDGGC